MEEFKPNKEMKAGDSIKIAEGAKYIHKPIGEQGTETVVYFFKEGKWWFKKGKIEETVAEEAQQVVSQLYSDYIKKNK